MKEKRLTYKIEKLQHLNDEVLMVVDNENKDWKGHILNIVDKLNELSEENEQLKQENQRVYGIIEDGGVLLTEKQLLDVIGEDKVDMFFREQETSNKLQEIKADAKTALLIIKAMPPLPFKISISEAKSLIRLSENVGELLDTEGD